MKNEALFRTGSVWKSIISMAVPSIIIILVMVLYNMADMFFVGCLGDTAQVAAVSVVGPVFSILAAVATMLGAGSSAIIARCFGAGEIEQGKTCSSLCFWSSFFLGVLVSIGLLVGRVPLLGALGTSRIFSLCRAVSSGPCTGCAAFYPVQQHGDAGACRGRSKRRHDRQSSGHAGQLHF